MSLSASLPYPRHRLQMFRARFSADDKGELFAAKNLVDAIEMVCACSARLPVATQLSIELAGDVLTTSAVAR